MTGVPVVLSAPLDGRQSETAMRIARGVRRLLLTLGFSSLPEVPLRSGRRADLVAINSKGEIWIVEIKSSLADFRSDQKWPDYRAHCDRLFFATTEDVPIGIFPQDAGLIVADGFGAAILRDIASVQLPAATRKEVHLRFARSAADRLHLLHDPGILSEAI